jgi:Ca2+/Na+ antiporter
MGLQEIAIGGIFISPLLVYALMGLIATFIVRSLLHRVVGHVALWYEAWFDISLFIILTAAITFLFATLLAHP